MTSAPLRLSDGALQVEPGPSKCDEQPLHASDGLPPRWMGAAWLAAYVGLKTRSGAIRWARAQGIQPIWRGRGWLYDRMDVDRRLVSLKGHGRKVRRSAA